MKSKSFYTDYSFLLLELVSSLFFSPWFNLCMLSHVFSDEFLEDENDEMMEEAANADENENGQTPDISSK